MAKPEKSSADLGQNLLAFAGLFTALVAHFSPAIAFALAAMIAIMLAE